MLSPGDDFLAQITAFRKIDGTQPDQTEHLWEVAGAGIARDPRDAMLDQEGIPAASVDDGMHLQQSFQFGCRIDYDDGAAGHNLSCRGLPAQTAEN